MGRDALPQMCPSLALLNQAHGRLAYAKHLGDLGLRNSPAICERANCDDICIAQPRDWVRHTALVGIVVSTLCASILLVHEVVAKEQMHGINARGDITPMERVGVSGDGFEVRDPRCAVGQLRASFDVYAPVTAGWFAVGAPQPAAAVRVVFDVRQKSSYEGGIHGRLGCGDGA